jgi:hypothetical protein
MLSDTRSDQERRYYELLVAQPPVERLRRGVSLSRTVRRLALAGLRIRHPGAEERELRARLAIVLYGRTIAQRLFGPLPADAR